MKVIITCMSILTAYSRTISHTVVCDGSIMPNHIPLIHLAQPRPFDLGDWGQFVDIDTTSQFVSKRNRVENLSHVQVYGNKVTQKISMDFDNSRYSSCDRNHYLNRTRDKHPVTYVIGNLVIPVVSYIASIWTMQKSETPKPSRSESCLMLCDSVQNLSPSSYMDSIDEESQEDLTHDEESESDPTWTGLLPYASTIASSINFRQLYPLRVYTLGKLRTRHVAVMSIVSMALFVLCM